MANGQRNEARTYKSQGSKESITYISFSLTTTLNFFSIILMAYPIGLLPIINADIDSIE